MFLIGSVYILSCMAAGVFGCHRAENPTTPRFEVHHEPIGDIWLGKMQFVDLFCGTPSLPNILGLPNIFQGIFRRSISDVNLEDLTAEEMNKYNLDHSLLYFRGQSYEYGAGMFMPSFINGTTPRDPAICGSAITWTLKGRSNCTFDQAIDMAHSYHTAFGEYALLTNNCHHFVDRLIHSLDDGHCEPFQGLVVGVVVPVP